MEDIFIIALPVLFLVFVAVAMLIKKKNVAGKFKIEAHKPRIQSYKRIVGGISTVEEIQPINDDKALFIFSNGQALQIYYKEIVPVSISQLFSKESPLFKIIGEENEKIGTNTANAFGSGNTAQAVDQETLRKRETDRTRVIELEANLQKEIDKAVERVVRIEKGKARDKGKEGQ